MRNRTRQQVVIALVLLVSVVLLEGAAWAATRGRMPLQNFLADLYDAGVGTYVPVFAFFALLLTAMNWQFGWISLGEGLLKLIVTIVLIAGGTAYIVGIVGGNIAEGATLVHGLASGLVP